MIIGNLEINPAKNPAVLDAGTWDPADAWRVISAVDEAYWNLVVAATRQNGGPPVNEQCVVYPGSVAQYRGSFFFLAGICDAQHVFIELGAKGDDFILGEPIGVRTLVGGNRLVAYLTSAVAIDSYVSSMRSDKSPRALGAAPRLGVGSRMTTAAWPGVWRAMNERNFRANPIQNSVREVNLLEDVLAGRPQRTNYMANFGTVPEGHAGSTFEGLWVAGVLEALKSAPSPLNAAGSTPAFGADADHITVRRSDDGLSRAMRVIESARHYTFFTLDVSDLLDYGAMNVTTQTGCPMRDARESSIKNRESRKEVIAYHRQYSHLDEAAAGRLMGKYRSALDAVEQLAGHISAARNGRAFDLELSIDETPHDIDTFACLTSETELTFLANEIRRRRLPVTHIAPNFGVEKELDYRGPDGLAGLEKRVQGLVDVAGDFGIMLDCHSGDDLKPATRRAVGRATKGNIHFKISPALQIIFAETMIDVVPDAFGFWWDDTLEYARREAAAGSGFAADCLRKYESGDKQQPSPDHAVFHYYNFASVGRRDERGQFVHREKFYDLPENFYCEYRERVCGYLCEVAEDVQMA